MIFLTREPERVRAKSLHTTLTSDPVPPKEGVEAAGSAADFQIRGQ